MKSSVTFKLKGEISKPGFKPLIWMLAAQYRIGGWITDDGIDSGVMRVDGDEQDINRFIRALPMSLYPRYRLRELKMTKRDPDASISSSFRILGSDQQIVSVPVDTAPCKDCLAEITNPKSRRYCYPFWSCSHCGPAYSAIRQTPFIRKNTYLASFPPCEDCRREYEDAADPVHYHSELLACPKCGPHLFLLDRNARELLNDDNPLCAVKEALGAGQIVAVQSLFGSFQLFLDPYCVDAVTRLRRCRKMPHEPLVIVAKNMEAVHRLCQCSEAEERLLSSKSAPVVLLRVKQTSSASFPQKLISPDSSWIAVSLPPTTLISLLFEHVGNCPYDKDYLIICGAGRDSGVHASGIDELLMELSGLADKFLCHDLRIGMECSSSVAVIREGAPQIWKRARGYVPQPIVSKKPLRRIVAAFGSDRENTVALGVESRIVASQLLGNLHDCAAAQNSADLLEHFCMLFDAVPDVVACDMNQDLFTTRAATAFAETYGIPLIQVQSQHARALSCMAESGLQHAFAFVMGDSAPGPDGSFWGADLLDVGIDNFQRLATFNQTPLHSPKDGIVRPGRLLVEQMLDSGVDIPDVLLQKLRVDVSELNLWKKTLLNPQKTVLSHSCIQIVDAVAASLGMIEDFCSYPEQATFRLLDAAENSNFAPEEIPRSLVAKFPYSVVPPDSDGLMTIDWTPFFRALADPNWFEETEPCQLAAGFFAALSESFLAMVSPSVTDSTCRDIILSGIIFSSELLTNLTASKLRKRGLIVHLHRSTPLNDSGIAIGQAYHAGLSN